MESKDEVRWMFLDAVSRMMVDRVPNPLLPQTRRKKYAFLLSKGWSDCKPQIFGESVDVILEWTEFVGKTVAGNKHALTKFHSPLLTRMAFPSSNDLDDASLWATLKQSIRSLGARGWKECKDKIAKAVCDDAYEKGDILYPFPSFLDRVSGELEKACLRDTAIINELCSLCMHARMSAQYKDASIERCRNVIKINQYLSIMALFLFVCETKREGRWEGLDLVSNFFEKNACDWNALRRYSYVLDIDSVTSRRITWEIDEKPSEMVYVMDDSEVLECSTDKGQEEGEQEWWLWVENAVKDSRLKNVSYSEIDKNELHRLLSRVDGQKTKTRSIVSILDTWDS